MAKDFSISTKGKKAVASARGFALVEEGTYVLGKPTLKLDVTKEHKKPIVKVTLIIMRGPHKGKQIGDSFTLMRKGHDDSDFGLRRFLGFMTAFGVKTPAKLTPEVVQAVAKAIAKRECVSEIETDVQAATEEYAERRTSKPVSYYSLKSKEGASLLGNDDAVDGDDDDDEEDEDDSEDEDDEDEDDDEEPPKKSKKSKKSAGKRAEPEDDDEDDDEDDEDDDEDDEDEDDEDDD